MQTIREVYSNPVYETFVAWCSAKGLRTMADLAGADLSAPALRGELSPAMLSRIKMVYTAYRRQHPEDFLSKPAPRRTATAAPSSVSNVAIHDYFSAHADQLIRLSDVIKALGIKRSEVQKVLADAPWAKMVDSSTYFFVKQDE